ncbi:STAS domain-containing protein [Nonomuraea sp. NN258]|uniref:STAS domain-containing protein n=1 Tax=Nonomuraea antri TaxID=2730852 RepID=UPI001568A3F9|nr:STAS domain-containing protein [Nonomuraea antri]NRQ30265.1 STAS domain-containing protein [Nonomuraea antri]
MDNTAQEQRLEISVGAAPLGAILTLRGALDMVTRSRLKDELDRAVCTLPDPPMMVLDVSGLTFCDSSGLSLLIAAWKKVEHCGGSLALIGVHGRLDRILRLSGLDRVLPSYPTLAEAERGMWAATRDS